MNSSIRPRSAYQRQRLGRLRLRHRARLRKRQLTIEAFEPRIVLSGTPQIIDLNPTDGASNPADFTQVGDVSYFVADDGTTGRELWVTDGTADGTSLVKDIQPGLGSSTPSELTNVNGMLYFVADDGNNGQELWTSDGTSAGTVMVRDINPGEGYQYPYGDGPLQSFPANLKKSMESFCLVLRMRPMVLNCGKRTARRRGLHLSKTSRPERSRTITGPILMRLIPVASSS